MRLYKKTICLVLPITVAFLILTITFSVLQSNNPANTLFAILANICICILTSGILICIQSTIGFYVARKESVLLFYKETMILEKKIIDYPYQNIGFIRVQNGLNDIQNVLDYFYNEFKWAYMMIDTSNTKNKIISSVISLYRIYDIQIEEFSKMENFIKGSLEYLEIPEQELIAQGKDVSQETETYNKNLKGQMDAIVKAFNNEENNQKRKKCLDTIEEYLFAKTNT